MAKRPTPIFLILIMLAIIAGASFFYATEIAPQNQATNEVLFRLGGQEYKREDLPLKYGLPFHEAENNAYQIQQRILQAAIVDAYVEQQMQQSGDARQTVLDRLFQLHPPTEAEINAFYEQNKGQISLSPEEARTEISNYLLQIDQQRQRQELLAKLQSLKELSVTLQPPHTPVVALKTAGYPAKGPEQARVTLVEFADYQCPHCKDAHLTLQQVLLPYLDRVRFIYMDFPINRSGISRTVAEGAVCAQQQGRFWEYQDLAFMRQQALHQGSAKELAVTLGLDTETFDRCLASPEPAERVKFAEQQAIQAGVTGTPTFFINGRKLRLHDVQGSLTEQLEQALSALR